MKNAVVKLDFFLEELKIFKTEQYLSEVGDVNPISRISRMSADIKDVSLVKCLKCPKLHAHLKISNIINVKKIAT